MYVCIFILPVLLLFFHLWIFLKHTCTDRQKRIANTAYAALLMSGNYY